MYLTSNLRRFYLLKNNNPFNVESFNNIYLFIIIMNHDIK